MAFIVGPDGTLQPADEGDNIQQEYMTETDLDAMGMLRTLLDSNAKLNTKLDQILQRLDVISSGSQSANAQNAMPVPALLPPTTIQTFEQIDTPQDIISFEENLKNEIFFQDMVCIFFVSQFFLFSLSNYFSK